MQRSRFKRLIHSGVLRKNKPLGEGGLLDLIGIPTQDGLPTVNVNFTLDNQSIVYTTLGIMGALIVSGVIVNKISNSN